MKFIDNTKLNLIESRPKPGFLPLRPAVDQTPPLRELARGGICLGLIHPRLKPWCSLVDRIKKQ